MKYQLCIFGNPVKHSISPQIHLGFARQFNLDVSYRKIKPPLDGFKKAVFDFKNSGGFGASITAPFKQEAFQIATIKTERAMIAQSVNTFIFQSNNIVGDNTDGVGLLRDIKNNIHYDLKNKKILILGAGGAARGILHPLLMENPAEIIIANRSIENAKILCDAFSQYGNLRSIHFTELKNSEVDIVIDSTSVDAKLLLPNSLLIKDFFYDLKYSGAASNDAAHFNGLGMVVEQAAEAFYAWTICRPTIQPFVAIAPK